jgi:hypothetical protein
LSYRDLTLEDVRKIVAYDKESGLFVRVKAAPHMPVGAICGFVHHTGYILIRVKNFRVPAHILAWLFITGEWPVEDVDHKDTDRANNREMNLRLSGDCGNAQNASRRSDNTSGFKGVTYFRRNRKWGASINCRGSRHFLGLFTIPELAHAARCVAATSLHGEFARAA